MIADAFRERTPDEAALAAAGFVRGAGGAWERSEDVCGGEFTLHTSVDAGGSVATRLTGTDGEDYELYRTNAAGTYVGEVRAAVDAAMRQIAQQCFRPAPFRHPATLAYLEAVRESYGAEPEFLWPKFPDNAAVRRADTGKWFAAVLTVKAVKLGLNAAGTVEIVDLRARPETMAERVACAGCHPGWHMNKRTWFTARLDDTVSPEALARWTAESWELAH